VPTVTLLALFGGLALLLYGVQLIGEGLQRAAGGQLRHLVTTMTRSRLTAVGSGALVTALTQSSSATTLLLIGFVSAGLVSFRQSLGVILGADIGTTFTVQLLAFNVQQFSLLLIGIGFAIGFFARRGRRDQRQAEQASERGSADRRAHPASTEDPGSNIALPGRSTPKGAESTSGIPG